MVSDQQMLEAPWPPLSPGPESPRVMSKPVRATLGGAHRHLAQPVTWVWARSRWPAEGVLREQLTLLHSGQMQQSEAAWFVALLAQVCVRYHSSEHARSLTARKFQKDGS